MFRKFACKSHVDIFSDSNWMMFTMKKMNTAAKHAKVVSGVSHVLHILRLEDGPLRCLPRCLTFYVCRMSPFCRSYTLKHRSLFCVFVSRKL